MTLGGVIANVLIGGAAAVVRGPYGDQRWPAIAFLQWANRFDGLGLKDIYREEDLSVPPVLPPWMKALFGISGWDAR